MDTIKEIKNIKQILDVDILTFTAQYAGLSSKEIDKVEAILYKDNVYIDEIELQNILVAIRNTAIKKQSQIAWELERIEREREILMEYKSKLDTIVNLNQ